MDKKNETVNVLGYFVHKDDKELNSYSVMVIINEKWSHTKELTGYCPQESHFGTDREYLKECRKISKDDYLKASKLFYTPAEYLQ
ncbi:hypothetical protein Q7A53_05895 [Halobacillus rhizosphaerae]|uniref:hypothetical protein n=1 Tax=Halobacillus rhizosphaerae TaxID=3064889 RepID=UPI00398A7BA1